jgi:transposase-like protein
MKITCQKCGNKSVQKYGKDVYGAQRFKCKGCGRVYKRLSPKNKINNERAWFRWWIKEGLSVRQISLISGHSSFKIKRIKNYWLKQEAPELYKDYARAKYLIFDGTYFKRINSLLLFINDGDNKVISCRYVDSENYENTYKMAGELKRFGVEPKSVTLDGLKPVIAAVKDVWPGIIIQRCLYHIERQGLQWLRAYPKTAAGQELRKIYKGITAIKDNEGKEVFTRQYISFLKEHREYINNLSSKEVGYKDLKKATSLISNAYDDMWHYLEDRKIPKTTNKVEGYFSELKQQYTKHKGLSKRNRDSYFKWYCYYKNT